MSDSAHEIDELSEFEQWLNTRNKWLQTAAKQLLDNKRLPNEDELTELVRLCKLEASQQDDPGFLKPTDGSFSAGAIQPVVRVENISEVYGVNAIKDGASLAFNSSNLTVIYGQNGSGKSSFARLLKQLCGSRTKEEIHPNIFSDVKSPTSAKCLIKIGDDPTSINWELNAEPHASLKYAQIFDSKTANHYTGSTESSYEPSSMRFISKLIAISDMVNNELNNEHSKLVRTLPQFPVELAETNESTWFSSLSSSVSVEDIDKLCQYGNNLEAERIDGENLLAERDINGRLVTIQNEIDNLERAEKTLNQLKEGLANEKAEQLYKAKELAHQTREAADVVAQQAFADAPLLGVGENTWRLMWEKAKEYSMYVAYKDHDFPVTDEGARCLLCQQELSSDSRNRLKGFEEFVTADLESNARNAENASKKLIDKIVNMPSQEDWITRLTQLQFDKDVAYSWYDVLTARHSEFTRSTAPENLTDFDWVLIDQALKKRRSDLLVDKNNITNLQQKHQRQKLETRIKQLKALQWLFQNKQAIHEERDRLIAVDLLQKAIKLTATNSLTTKRNELVKTELVASYQCRFTKELKALGGERLPIVPMIKSRGKGIITFGLTLKGDKNGFTPNLILSEGEARIAALAAFLADTMGSNQLAPFIFDDPISSLDQNFEERVVARLVDLAKTRQVIIFTHRLSLVTLVETVVKKHSENPINDKITHNVQWLRRLGEYSGILVPHNLREMRPHNALNYFRDHIIPKLKKLQNEGNADSYDSQVKGACSDFRIILEKIIETVLLNDVVVRFRRDITTKGKLWELVKISFEDCSNIDQLMTKYSVYEHSQTDELPQEPVDVNNFEQDVLFLISWMDEFKKRQIK